MEEEEKEEAEEDAIGSSSCVGAARERECVRGDQYVRKRNWPPVQYSESERRGDTFGATRNREERGRFNEFPLKLLEILSVTHRYC